MSTIWITGASSGIGRALALHFARGGHEVAASARRAERLERLAEESRATEGRIHAYPLDVADPAAARAAVGEIERDLGAIDLAILAAGINHRGPARQLEAAALARVIGVNLLGIGNCLEPLLEVMVARRRGRIALVGSLAAYGGRASAPYYGPSKAALINLAEALKLDLEGSGVRVQLIQPGSVRTPMTESRAGTAPFLMPVEEAAERIARGLASRRFETAFPRRLTLPLKLLRYLPYPLYFALVAWAAPEAPTMMAWLNEPPAWQERDGVLRVTTGEATDFWRETHYGFVHDNGHLRFARAEGDFTAEVTVSGDYRALYDQAGLMLRLDERHWLKAGVEQVEGHGLLSVVVTREFSDWSTAPGFAAPDPVRLRLSRHGTALRVEWAPLDGGRFAMLRLAWLPAGPAMVGPMCCSPQRAGFEASFRDFRLGAPIETDLHG